MKSLHIRREQIRVGQVIEEDDDWVTLKIAKSDLVAFDVEDGDAFFTILFIQPHGDELMAVFPWGTE